MEKKRMFHKAHPKGSITLVTVFFILMSITLLGFSYDVARVMYFKSYTRNLASVMALSIVNEAGFVYHDNVNGARVVIVDSASSKPLKGYKGKFYADKRYVNELYNRNKDGMDVTYHVDPNINIVLNPRFTPSGNVIPGSTDKKRFEIGSDGINGEVEVHITAKVDLYFLKSLYRSQVTVHESAIAQPKATVKKYYNKIRDEQEITFEYIKWD